MRNFFEWSDVASFENDQHGLNSFPSTEIKCEIRMAAEDTSVLQMKMTPEASAYRNLFDLTCRHETGFVFIIQ